MKITDDNIFSIYLKARDVYERALVLSSTSPRNEMYEDRQQFLLEALKAMLEALEIEVKL